MRDEKPTYIKMDIEGYEASAIEGAREIIQQHQPVLAICVYHKQQDLWQIPLLMKSLCGDYQLFLRPHLDEGWDLVCYAIPRKRLGPKYQSVK